MGPEEKINVGLIEEEILWNINKKCFRQILKKFVSYLM
jgi:hypothetical protein